MSLSLQIKHVCWRKYMEVSDNNLTHPGFGLSSKKREFHLEQYFWKNWDLNGRFWLLFSYFPTVCNRLQTECHEKSFCKWALCLSNYSCFGREDPDLTWKSSRSFLVPRIDDLFEWRSKISSDQHFRVFLPLSSQAAADMEHMFLGLLCLCLCCFRQEFGSDQCPDLTREVYLQDIHCVGSLCKLYFRELPNPLLTYELYEKFTVGVSISIVGTGRDAWMSQGEFQH